MGRRGGRRPSGKFHGKKRKFQENPSKNSEETEESENIPREMINVQEIDVGITEYVGDAPGFTGIIKCKYSDFQVNEIDLEGNVIKLTDTSLPKCPNSLPENIETDQEDSLLSSSTIEYLKKLVSDESPDGFYEIDVTDLSKIDRTRIHSNIRELFGKSLLSNTISKDEKKIIKCFKANKANPERERNRWLWPHQYIYFVVHKTNLDTMRAATFLASNMGIKASAIAYAGTKDKRALTSQMFCIKRREPAKILEAARRTQNVIVGNFSCRPDVLKLGQLRGNRFRIALREITVDQIVIEKSVESFRENGFINYYGLQRFGNSAIVPTYSIGKALLKGQWQEACELILKPRPGDLLVMQSVRECWWTTKDAQKALSLINSKDKCIELDLLKGLAEHGPNNYINALEHVPRNARLLYIHSYQSLIWNQIASKRFKMGMYPLEGDLVLREEASEKLEEFNISFDEQQDDEQKPEENVEEESKFKNMVKKLSEEDIKSGKYTIFDIVLPLPGHDITYPENICKKWYEELLAIDELSSEKLKQKVKTYSLGGTYRKFMAKPDNLSWRLMKYSSTRDLLIASDVDELKGKQIPEVSTGEKTALLLDFCLPSCTYATMALREILKTDTSTAAQIKLNPKEDTVTESSVKRSKI